MFQSKAAQEFLVVGHICHDVVPGGYAPGGAAAYAGLFSQLLGYRTAILTAWGEDFRFAPQFWGMDLHAVPSPHTTVFENIYQPDGQRVQYLHSRAALLQPSDFPAHWQVPKAVMLGPICDEVSLDFLDFFSDKNTVTCACPQGWMRAWDADGLVSPKPDVDWSRLSKADTVSMSIADVGGDWQLVEEIAVHAPLLLVTQGADGVTVFEKRKKAHYPATKVEEQNPTGAGDVFAAAFTLSFAEGKNVEKAVKFAHQMAGETVAGKMKLL